MVKTANCSRNYKVYQQQREINGQLESAIFISGLIFFNINFINIIELIHIFAKWKPTLSIRRQKDYFTEKQRSQTN